MADAADLVEVGRLTVTEAIDERLECMTPSSILGFELAQMCLRTAHDELRERRRLRPQARAQWFERRSESGRLGDRMARVRRRHGRKCGTVQASSGGARPGGRRTASSVIDCET